MSPQALMNAVLKWVIASMEGVWKTNKQIADGLSISTNTVLTPRKNIFKNLGIRSVAVLTIYAIAYHIVKLDGIRQFGK